MRRRSLLNIGIALGVMLAALCLMKLLISSDPLMSYWQRPLRNTGSYEVPGADGTAATAAMKSAAPNPTAPMPWPPQGARASDVIRILDPYSRSGNASASCRISLELLRCESAARVLDSASLVANSSDSGAARSSATHLLGLAESNLQKCAGLAQADFEQAYRYQQRAADHGSHAMKRLLVNQPALDASAFLQHLEQWQDYRRRARLYAREALQWHDRADIIPLLQIYSWPSDLHLMGRLSEGDDAVFLALLDVANREDIPVPDYLRKIGADMKSNMSADDLARYRRVSDQLSVHWSGDARGVDRGDPFDTGVCENTGPGT